MNVVIVHRWDGKSQSDWYPWLRAELKKRGTETVIPTMPNTEEPDIDGWVTKLQRDVPEPTNDTYLVGHSIGNQAIMRYLEQLPARTRVGGLVFVAGWFYLSNLEDEDVEATARPWMETPIDTKAVKEKAKNIKVFISSNDPYGMQQDNKKRFERELAATVVIEKDKGHFTADDGVTEIPEVLEAIESMQKNPSMLSRYRRRSSLSSRSQGKLRTVFLLC